MKNRFNNLTSKEWLPFQKSWFQYKDDEKLYKENIRFFMKFDDPDKAPNFFFHGSEKQLKIIKRLRETLGFNLITKENIENFELIQFALIDLREELKTSDSIENYWSIKDKYLPLCFQIKDKLHHRKFISIFMNNLYTENEFYPVAWDMAKTLGLTYSLKDEKMGCYEPEQTDIKRPIYFQTSQSFFYSLYFRNDENSPDNKTVQEFGLCESIKQQESKIQFPESFTDWFILKPKARKKKEILHPAKYPEDLAQMFITAFTNEGQNVFDPMSGTGSTQLSALMTGRNGYGTELSEFFTGIANERCKQYKEESGVKSEFLIKNMDARKISQMLSEPKDFPPFDYIFTSPPYWDMLNMKGAENQAQRVKKGLQTNYSDNKEDLGNVSDYNDFLEDLSKIYFDLYDLIKPGGYMTIVVKNIKKKGKNYPFAWDLAQILQKKYILLPESFWLQDDISIAPYGYGNTFVSNTFHQYCLSFQKPF